MDLKQELNIPAQQLKRDNSTKWQAIGSKTEKIKAELNRCMHRNLFYSLI
jgi:hypothetical protein